MRRSGRTHSSGSTTYLNRQLYGLHSSTSLASVTGRLKCLLLPSFPVGFPWSNTSTNIYDYTPNNTYTRVHLFLSFSSPHVRLDFSVVPETHNSFFHRLIRSMITERLDHTWDLRSFQLSAFNFHLNEFSKIWTKCLKSVMWQISHATFFVSNYFFYSSPFSRYLPK